MVAVGSDELRINFLTLAWLMCMVFADPGKTSCSGGARALCKQASGARSLQTAPRQAPHSLPLLLPLLLAPRQQQALRKQAGPCVSKQGPVQASWALRNLCKQAGPCVICISKLGSVYTSRALCKQAVPCVNKLGPVQTSLGSWPRQAGVPATTRMATMRSNNARARNKRPGLSRLTTRKSTGRLPAPTSRQPDQAGSAGEPRGRLAGAAAPIAAR